MVFFYSTYEQINPFAIDFMINSSLHVNKVFRKKLNNSFDLYFMKKMKTIRYVVKKRDTCVIAIIMFYETNGKKPKKWYRVLSCVLYSLIINYVCIDYLSFQ